MGPPPPRATLLPYTTLFRSDRVVEHVRVAPVEQEPHDVLGPLAARVEQVLEHLAVLAPQERVGPGSAVQAHAPDRKSTRLNSSHANTSYAVFCLKKTPNTPP